MEELINSFENIKVTSDFNIKILECQPFNVQKCYLSHNTFINLKAKPGDCVFINDNKNIFLCRVFLNKFLQDNKIELDQSVQLENKNNIIQQYDNIKLLKSPITLSKVYLDIIFETFECLSRWNSQNDECCSSLKKYILSLFVVADDCVVNLKCLGKNFNLGIEKLYIKFSEEDIKNTNIGYIANKTKVIINTKLTLDQVDLKTKKLPPLYGLEYPISRLIEIINLNNMYSKLNDYTLPQPTKQILLVGPSGCGKSSIIPLIAQATDTLMVSIFDHNINSSDPGETEANLRKMFEHAFKCSKTMGKCIINLDEISNICPQRKNKSSHLQRAITQLLHLLDKAHNIPGIIVIATTNKPEGVDPSVRRHGRLETEIYIGPPTENQRSMILDNIISELNLNLSKPDHKILYKSVGSMTPGYVGADLKMICQKLQWIITSEKININNKTLDYWIDKFRQIISGMTPVSLKGSLGVITTRQTSFNDLAGLDDIKKTLESSILWPLKHPEAFIRMGIMRPKGVLLYGPPGCAKTSLVRALASLGTLSLLSISAAELYSPFVGDAEHLIMTLFKRARQNSPCILFIDEIDAVAGSRSDSVQSSVDVQERILAALLTQMDGVGNQMMAADLQRESSIDDGIIVIGATNRPDMIDAALLRPGRFDKHIFVPPPDYNARVDILKLITNNMPIDDVDIQYIADKTELYSGADLKNICTEAALIALSQDGMDVAKINKNHFDKALSTTRPSLNLVDLQRYAELFK